MIDRWFRRAFGFVERRRVGFLALLTLATGLAIGGVRFIAFDSSLAVMFPRDPEVRRALEFLQEVRFSGKVVVSVACTDPTMVKDDFLAAVSRFAGTLVSPHLARTVMDPEDPKMLEDLGFFVRNLPQILDDADRAGLDAELTPDAVSRLLKRRYAQLSRPEGGFLASAIRRDPLGLQERIGEKIRRISSSFGYDVSMEKGNLVSRDGRHALLLFETPVAMTDMDGSRALVDDLKQWLAGLPPGLAADIICGHTHTVSNQEVIQADIQRVSVVEAVVFIVLFLALFRHPAAIWIFLIPMAAVAIALNACAWAQGGRASALVVGLGSVLAGIATDYGNHVFITVRHSADRLGSLTRVLRPLVHGALITLAMFLSFLFAGIAGYRQIGGFAMTSIGLALVFAIFLLPQLVRSRPQSAAEPAGESDGHRRRRPWDPGVAAVYVLVMAVGLAMAIRVPFDPEIMRMDGTAKDILDQEARFHEVWGSGDSQFAFLVVGAPDPAQATELNQAVYRRLCDAVGSTNVLSLAMLWPARGERERRGQAWTEFWKDGREARLKNLLAEKGKPLGFAEDGFAPFFEKLYEGTEAADDPQGNAIFDRIGERFVLRDAEGVRCLTYFPDQADAVAVAAGIAAPLPGAFVVSRRNLADAMSRIYHREVGQVSVIALALIVLVTVAGLRDFRRCTLAFLPSATGMVTVLAVMAGFGYSLTIANLIAGIVIVGLCMDFGILMVHAYEHGEQDVREVRMALHMSAATMGVGSGVLLLARHPALFSIGLTLSVGILAGYFTARIVLPALFRLMRRDGRARQG